MIIDAIQRRLNFLKTDHLGFLALTFAILVSAPVDIPAAESEQETPPWMEDVVTRDRKVYLIPKGAKKEIIGSQVIVESSDEYVARRLYEIQEYLDDRFSEIDKNYASVAQEIDKLKKTVETLEKELSEKILAIEKSVQNIQNSDVK